MTQIIITGIPPDQKDVQIILNHEYLPTMTQIKKIKKWLEKIEKLGKKEIERRNNEIELKQMIQIRGY